MKNAIRIIALLLFVFLLQKAFSQVKYSAGDPYIFDGIDIWSFNSEGWNKQNEFTYVLNKMDYFDIVQFVIPDMEGGGYYFYRTENAKVNTYEEILKTFTKDFGKPYYSDKWQSTWIIDSTRSVFLNYGSENLYIYFQWTEAGC